MPARHVDQRNEVWDMPCSRMVLTSLLILLTFSALASLWPATAGAQSTTGTVRGKVVEASTGEALAAANLILFDSGGASTGMGAMSSRTGEYVIINVPPGRYTLRASMMGYAYQEVRDLLVQVDVSAYWDFRLDPVVLDVGETVVVTAERDILHRDVAGSKQSYTIDDMERLPVRSTTDILTLQTSVYREENPWNEAGAYSVYQARGLEVMHMRGGRHGEVAFLIDGMQATNLFFGGRAARVSPFSLAEMVVLAGGMSAEYGNALSGVVNMVTREGGSSYDANLEVETSEHHGWGASSEGRDPIRDYTATRGYLGGPVPGTRTLRFFLSGSASTGRYFLGKKDDVVYDPTPSSPSPDIVYDPTDPYRQYGEDGRPIWGGDLHAGWLGYGFDDPWDGMLNLTWKPRASYKLSLSVQKNGRWSSPYRFINRYQMMYGLPEHLQRAWTLGVPREGKTLLDRRDLVPGTGEIEFENESSILFEDHGRIALLWNHQLGPAAFYSIRASHYDYNRTMRVKRWVNAYGYHSAREFYFDMLAGGLAPLWSPSDPMRQVTLLPIPYSRHDLHARTYGWGPYQLTGPGILDGSGQFWTDHFDDTRTIKADATVQVGPHHQVRTGAVYNALTLDHHDVQWAIFEARYHHNPWELGLYLQDKIEYDFLIISAGLRYEAGNAGSVPYWTDPRDPFHPDTGELVPDPFDPSMAPLVSGRTRHGLAPRLGISHPVTDRAVLYFNYGTFYQHPVYRNVYLRGSLLDENPLIGNPNMESEQSTHYEFGYKHQFTDLLAFQLTLWAKETANMVTTERIPPYASGWENPYTYTVFLNYDYATARGVDLSIRRRYGDNWSGELNYSYMTTEANRDSPWQGYFDERDRRMPNSLAGMVKRPRPTGWDQPHRIGATLTWRVPEGSGPRILGLPLLERVTASLIFRAHSGLPYTPTTKVGMLERNSQRRPWVRRWDMKLYRDVRWLGLDMSLFANIRNLFDRRNVMVVFTRSGSPEDPGPDEMGYSDLYDRFSYYDTPRQIDVGIRIFF